MKKNKSIFISQITCFFHIISTNKNNSTFLFTRINTIFTFYIHIFLSFLYLHIVKLKRKEKKKKQYLKR